MTPAEKFERGYQSLSRLARWMSANGRLTTKQVEQIDEIRLAMVEFKQHFDDAETEFLLSIKVHLDKLNQIGDMYLKALMLLRIYGHSEFSLKMYDDDALNFIQRHKSGISKLDWKTIYRINYLITILKQIKGIRLPESLQELAEVESDIDNYVNQMIQFICNSPQQKNSTDKSQTKTE